MQHFSIKLLTAVQEKNKKLRIKANAIKNKTENVDQNIKWHE